MKNPPSVIYLQWDNDDPYEGVTWCTDRINDEDIEYIKGEHITELENAMKIIQRHYVAYIDCGEIDARSYLDAIIDVVNGALYKYDTLDRGD